MAEELTPFVDERNPKQAENAERCTHANCRCRAFHFNNVTPAYCLNCNHSCEWHDVPAKELF